MRPSTTKDVFDLMDSYVTAAAVGTAMELGLFWLLDEGPMDADAIAKELQIPPRRCHYWLDHIESTGLLERIDSGFSVSGNTRTSIRRSEARTIQDLLEIPSVIFLVSATKKQSARQHRAVVLPGWCPHALPPTL